MQKASTLLLLVCLATVVQSQIVIAPSTVDFGDVPIGQNATRTVYVMNVGDEPVTMSGVGGGVNEPFEVTQSCQNNVVAPGQKCLMLVSFTPTEKGPATATSQGTWNDVEYNISLTANGVDPQISIAPSELDFGTVAIGSSVKRIVYVTNVGDAPIVMEGVGTILKAPFWGVGTCPGATVNPGNSCEMIILYIPKTAGPASYVASGDWNGVSFNIQLTGNTAETQV